MLSLKIPLNIRLKYALSLTFLFTVLLYHSQPQIRLNTRTHRGRITKLILTPDAKTVITCSSDKTIKFWDAKTGTFLDELSGNIGKEDQGVYSKIGISHDGKLLAAFGKLSDKQEGVQLNSPNGIQLFDLNSRKMKTFLPMPSQNCNNLAFLDANQLIVSLDSTILVYDISTSTVKRSISIPEGMAVADFQHEKLFFATENGHFKSYSPSTGLISDLATFEGEAFDISTDLASGRIAVSFNTGQVAIFSSEGKSIQQISFEDPKVGLAFSKDGKQLLVGHLYDGNSIEVYNWNGTQYDPLSNLRLANGIVGAVSAGDSQEFYVAGGTNYQVWKLKLIDAKLSIAWGTKINHLPFQAASSYASSVAFSFQNGYNEEGTNFPHEFMFNSFEKDISPVIPMGTILYMMPKPVMTNGTLAAAFNYSTGQIDLTNNGKPLNSIGERAISLCWLPNGLIAIGSQKGTLRVYNIYGVEVADLVGHNDDVTSLTISSGDAYLVSSSVDGTIRHWNMDELTYNDTQMPIIGEIGLDESLNETLESLGLGHLISSEASEDYIEALTTLFQNGYNQLGEGLFQLWSVYKQMFTNPLEPQLNMYISPSEEWLIWDKNGFYTGSKKGAQSVGFHINNGESKEASFYPLEDFDYYYNRPDIIESQIEIDSVKVNMYRGLYELRLKKMGLAPEKIKAPDLSKLPKISSSIISSTVNNSSHPLSIIANDPAGALDRLYVFINGVPVFGKAGLSLQGANYNSQGSLTVSLSEGENLIKMYVSNKEGVQSLKEIRRIVYVPAQKIEKRLYLVTVGVSNYQDESLNLNYCVKDAKDIASTLGQTELYDSVVKIQFFDKDVTREKLQTILTLCEGMTVDDQLIFFIAGHGMLDDEQNYYYVTYNTNVSNIKQTGLSFEELENLISSLPARKKLLLMDTCHSGEPEENSDVDMVQFSAYRMPDPNVSISESASRGGETEAVNSSSNESDSLQKIGLRNSIYLLEEKFNDFNNISGVEIIAASSGEGYAYESEEWNNGVFTYSIIRGLKDSLADENKDQSITISELKKFALTEVDRLTGGKQIPTFRQSIYEFDYRLK